MGLLKNILKMAAEKVISEVTTAAKQTSAPSYSGSAAAKAPVQAEAPERTDAEWKAYFRGILSAEFPAYAVREQVAVTELAGAAADEFKLYDDRPRQAYKAEWGEPYTFVLYAGGSPKGIVMLGKGHSHDSNVKYLIARMYAQKLGLPYINFYTQMPNERAYVIGRIRKFLG